MKNFKLIFSVLTLLLLSSFSLVSCQSFFVKMVADKNVNKKILTYKNENGTTLVYLPTVHTGKKEYFQSIKKIVDSLRKENFLVAHEGVLLNSNNPDYETNAKKLRKILGFHIGNMKTDSQDALPNFYNKKKYIIQNDSLIGINRKTDSLFDVKLEDLINDYERKYGEIALNEYDMKTALNEHYQTKNKSGCVYCITQEFRNPLVKNKVEENKHKNIVLLFGKGHKFFLHASFLDLGYKLVNGKL